MLPDLVIGWQAKVSPTLNPAGHVVSAGVLQGPIPVICGWTCLMCPVALCTFIKEAEVRGWELMKEAMGPVSPACPQHSLRHGGPPAGHSCSTDLGDLPP